MSRLPRAETVLPVLIVLGAIVLAASEFMVAFEFTPPGGEVQMEQSVADRHSYAMLVISVFALAALFAAIAGASRPAAFAVAALGGLALLLFLILDLPDAGKVGPLEDFITAKAEPQIGFWLQALGSVALGLGGAAFATLSTAQLEAIRERVAGRSDSGAAEERPATGAEASARRSGDREPPAGRGGDGDAGRRSAVPLRNPGGSEGPGRRGRRRRPTR